MVEHRGLVNTILSQLDKFHVTAADHCLQFSSASFDAFLYGGSCYWFYLSGASLYIIKGEESMIRLLL